MKNIAILLMIGVMAVAQAATRGTALGHFSTGILELFANVVKAGGDIWDKLATTQAQDVLAKLATEAADLEVKKSELKSMLEQSVQNNTTQVVDVSQLVGGLQNQVKAMRSTMDKFGEEIDKASPTLGDHFRIEIGKAEVAKGAELESVKAQWQQGKHVEAINALDAAIAKVQTMQKGISCLQNSITRKASACNEHTLEPIPAT